MSDFREPGKLVFGTIVEWADELLSEVYAPLLSEHDALVVRTDPPTAR